MILNIDGRKVNVTNWPEFKKQLLFVIGQGVAQAIREEIKRLKLVDTGQFARIKAVVDGDSIVLTSDAPYAVYLEFGTLDMFNADSFDMKVRRKSEMSKEERKAAPKGIAPFAPFRRILFNQKKMEMIIKRSLRAFA